MIYSILRFFIKSLLGFYFRRIHISGLENFSKDKPTILACNHPSSFMEALLLACYLPRDLHFIVRGDVFKNKALKWFLKQTHQIPIYRLRDGMANLRNNSSSFSYCNSAFRKNAAIIIFSESTTQYAKRLRPLHRGTWRLAYNAIEDNPSLDLQIVPIGINFVDVDRFRSEVMIAIGTTIHVNKFINSSKLNKRETIIRGTEELAIKLKAQIVHFEDEMSEEMGNHYLLELINKSSNNKIVHNGQQFLIQKRFATYFSQLSLEQKKDTSMTLNAHLSMMGIQPYDGTLELSQESKSSIWRVLILIIPGILGFLVNVIPFTIASKMRKLLVKQIEFYAPIRIGLWMIIMGIYLIIIFLTGYCFFGWVAIIVFLMPFLIRYWIELYDVWHFKNQEYPHQQN